MRNQDVISAFAKGSTKAVKANSVSIGYDGNTLFSYGTAIAQRLANGKYIINETKYSVTTSKAQSYVRYYIPSGLQIPTTKVVPIWTKDLTKYVAK